jgi:DNA-binding transcriptional LysR family regulator
MASKLKIAFEVDGLDAQLRFAEKGLGFAVLPRGTVSGFGYSKTLTSRLIVEPVLPIHIVVASLPHIENQKPHVAQLRDELVQRISATLSKRFFRECA